MKRSHLLGIAVLTLLLGSSSAALAHHISGKVWCDKDYDGNFDSTDTLLANITARARSLDASPGTDYTDNTDSNGFYEIGLPARTDRYSVRLINLPSGWTVVNPSAGNWVVQITTGNSSTDHKENVNFLVQGCAPHPTTTTTSSTTTTTKKTTTTTTSTSSYTSTTQKTTTTSTSTSTWCTMPQVSCACSGTPVLVDEEGRFNNDGDLHGSIGANDPNGRIQFGKGVLMADGTKVTAHSVTVGNGSSVDHVAANDVQVGTNGIIRSGQSLPSLPIIQPFCDVPDFQCGHDAVLVQVGDTSAPLPPGTYGRVRVLNDGHLRLQPGVFQFCDLKTGRGSTIEAMGPVTLNVVGNVNVGSGSRLMPSIGQPPIVLNVRGKQVRVSQNGVAEVILTAPFAKITLGRDSLVRGCFCVETARTDKHITLMCEE
jgi:hypothetical protein